MPPEPADRATRPWLSLYPSHVAADIADQAARHASLTALLDEACTRWAGRVAYLSLGRAMRYAELDALARAFAAWLQGQGVQRGDRVALMMPNLLQYPVCLLGAWRAGAVVVNTNPLYTAPELVRQLADADVHTVVIAEHFAHTLQQALPALPGLRVVVTRTGDLLGPLRGPLVNWVVQRIQKRIPPWHIAGAIPFAQVLREGRALPWRPPELSHDDLACLQYTGGTTGAAKGAMLTHGNLVHNLYQACAWVEPELGNGPDNLVVTALPLYHVFALMANCLTFLHLGGRNLLIADPRNLPAFVRQLRPHRMTAITGVNTLFNALAARPDFQALDFSALRITLGGGTAVQEAVAGRWEAVTGNPIVQAYGLTETSPAVSINPLHPRRFSNSIGVPLPSTEIVIRDEAGQALPPGAPGELCVRGPQVMAGYWRQPDETAAALDADGFLRTGDVVQMDTEGCLHLLDRKKDVVMVSGFNVYPNEVEAAAALHPLVREAAAIGVADERSGECVKLFAVRTDASLSEQALIAHCRQHLAAYKVPRHIEFRDNLPRTNVGKVLRRALKEETTPPLS